MVYVAPFPTFVGTGRECINEKERNRAGGSRLRAGFASIPSLTCFFTTFSWKNHLPEVGKRSHHAKIRRNIFLKLYSLCFGVETSPRDLQGIRQARYSWSNPYVKVPLMRRATRAKSTFGTCPPPHTGTLRIFVWRGHNKRSVNMTLG